MKKNNKNLLSISGKIGSGKDLLGKIFQALLDRPTAFDKMNVVTEEDIEYYIWDRPKYEVKKFAGKLKDMVCLLLNCTREQLENREFKEKELGEEWWYYTVSYRCAPNETEGGLFATKEEALEYYYSIGEKKDELNLDVIKSVKLTPRLLLQLLGTEAGRNIIHPNIWCNSLFSKYIPNSIRCNNCYWYGEEQDLVRGEDEESVFDGCPTCDTDNYLMDIRQSKWIITDTRFPNEFEAIKSRGGVCIKIERIPKIRVQHSGQEDDFTLVDYDPTNQKHVDLLKGERIVSKEHESEIALDNQTFDYVFLNNGSIKDLVEEAKKFLKDYEYIK